MGIEIKIGSKKTKKNKNQQQKRTKTSSCFFIHQFFLPFLSLLPAQRDETYILILLTNEGPTVRWFLHQAPDCGALYPITPDLELNGGNPCPGGVCNTPLSSGTNLTEIVTLDNPYLIYLFRTEDSSAFVPPVSINFPCYFSLLISSLATVLTETLMIFCWKSI